MKAVFRLNGREVVWTSGTEDPQNLMGTTRTLDRCDGKKLGRNRWSKGSFRVRDGQSWTRAPATC
ncbi:MAG: hypothetical protein V8Q54_10210 [Alistipes senegalensis]